MLEVTDHDIVFDKAIPVHVVDHVKRRKTYRLGKYSRISDTQSYSYHRTTNCDTAKILISAVDREET